MASRGQKMLDMINKTTDLDASTHTTRGSKTISFKDLFPDSNFTTKEETAEIGKLIENDLGEVIVLDNNIFQPGPSNNTEVFESNGTPDLSSIMTVESNETLINYQPGTSGDINLLGSSNSTNPSSFDSIQNGIIIVDSMEHQLIALVLNQAPLTITQLKALLAMKHQIYLQSI
ncbi:uncharacterized protein LOC120355779 isoform X1 [Nilaparvata lugens]|uniref:uncharacterized protein LOC120355779 isoform X1 n=1 Tax=Nilaparvata lugens TaxID=108931 RepID=UPI00193CA4F2|nr:uncharacterized protein LOC120355779 isoform X1 [Nilaparvata lugens]